jgi:hypothetical protein
MANTVYEAEVKYRADTGELLSKTNAIGPMIVSRLSRVGTAAGNAFSRGFSIAAKAGLAALATGGALAIVMAKRSIEAAVEQEAAEKKLAAVLRATGGAAGFTSRQLADYAGELQRVTTFGDDAILGAMSLLATFKSVSGETFKRTVSAALDLSEVFGTDLNSSILMLGKSLQDPARGLLALTRAGVTFSTEQKSLIKSLVESGRLLEAQDIILREVTGQVGGSAKAAVNTYAGAWKNLKNQLSDTSEVIGFALLRSLKELGPLITTAADGAQVLAEQLADAIEGGKVDIGGMNDLLVESIGIIATLGDQWRLLGHHIAITGVEVAKAMRPPPPDKAGPALLLDLLEKYADFLDKHGPGAGTPAGEEMAKQRREFIDNFRQTNEGREVERQAQQDDPLTEIGKNLEQDAAAIAERIKKKTDEIRKRMDGLREAREAAAAPAPAPAAAGARFNPLAALAGLNRAVGFDPKEDLIDKTAVGRGLGGLLTGLAGKAGELLGAGNVAGLGLAGAAGGALAGAAAAAPAAAKRNVGSARFESLDGLSRSIQQSLKPKSKKEEKNDRAAQAMIDLAKVVADRVAKGVEDTAKGVGKLALGFGD